MRERDKYESSLALEVLRRGGDGSFLKWAERNLSIVEPPLWKTREVYPKRGRRLSGIIEIAGLPEVGKSEGFRFVRDNLGSGIRGIFLPELELNLPGGRTVTRADAVLMRRMGGLEMENNWLEMVKLGILAHGFKKIIDLLITDTQNKEVGDPILMVCERGPNDILAMSSMVGHMALGKQELPAYWEEHIIEDGVRFDNDRYLYPGYGSKFLEVFLQALAMAEWVDAAVLYGYGSKSFETVKARRQQEGSPPEGPWVNQKNWPLFLSGYGWWLGSIYPLLRKRYGTGLLVIDGEGDLKENNQKVLEYCRRVTLGQY